jgi:ribonuclease D
MADELVSCPLLAVDLEYFNAIKTEDQCAILSLIQISTDKSDYIFDCFMTRDFLRESEKFKNLFKNTDYVKILHGSDSDLKFLVADLGVVTLNVFDTARALLFLQKIPSLK